MMIFIIVKDEIVETSGGLPHPSKKGTLIPGNELMIS